MRGTEGGLTLFSGSNWDLNAIGRLRFFDIPKDYQNIVQIDPIDWGFQYTYGTKWNGFLDLEIMSDNDFRTYGNIRGRITLEKGRLELEPFAEFKVKSSEFNDYYYGLTVEDPGTGIESTLGFKGKLHVISNLYLLGAVEITRLDQNTADISFINKQHLGRAVFGFGFFNHPNKELKKELSTKPYIRLAQGWATPSNLDEILTGNFKKDSYNNKMTSLFYGYPITDELFSLPIDLYITPGLVYHWTSDVQNSTLEYCLGIKFYYTFNTTVRFRIGVAEGLSYVTDVTYIEKHELEENGYETSNLMNYMDFSLDMNIGDLVRKNSLKHLWLGYSIHHRSAIFETASQFGRIKGGSNYNTLYLQYHF